MKEFFKNIASGALIGIAMIIPGVSGGTIAVLLNIYDKLLSSISNLTKKFKQSIIFLLPIMLGAVLAFAAAYYPLKWGLDKAPLPTILLFVGLMLGSLPKLIKTGASNGFKLFNLVGIILPIAALIGICYVPMLGDINLGTNMPLVGYFALVGVGVVGSCALVVPGISGSMCLLILGYYNPLLACISGLRVDFMHYALVLILFAIGLLIGFFTIAKLMKYLLNKFPRGTYWAIIGFVIGNFPAIFIQFFTDSNYVATVTPVQIAVGVVLCVLGATASFLLTAYAERRNALLNDGKQPASKPMPSNGMSEKINVTSTAENIQGNKTNNGEIDGEVDSEVKVEIQVVKPSDDSEIDGGKTDSKPNTDGEVVAIDDNGKNQK